MKLQDWWDNLPCNHDYTAASIYGYAAHCFCKQCNMAVNLLLKDDKTIFTAKTDRNIILENVTIPKAARFIQSLHNIMVLKTEADPNSEYFEYDKQRFNELKRILIANGVDM